MKISKRAKVVAWSALALTLVSIGYSLIMYCTSKKLRDALRYDGLEYLQARAAPPFTTVTKGNSHIVFEGTTGGEMYEKYRKSLEALAEKAAEEHNLEVNILVKESVSLINPFPDKNKVGLGTIDRVGICILGATISLEDIVVVTPDSYHIGPENDPKSSQLMGEIGAAIGIGIYKFLERYKPSIQFGIGDPFYYDKSDPEIKELKNLIAEAKKHALLDRLTVANLMGMPDEWLVSRPGVDETLILYADYFAMSLKLKQQYNAFLQALPEDERKIAEGIMGIVERRME